VSVSVFGLIDCPGTMLARRCVLRGVFAACGLISTRVVDFRLCCCCLDVSLRGVTLWRDRLRLRTGEVNEEEDEDAEETV
jgi:hypothetical protein